MSGSGKKWNGSCVLCPPLCGSHPVSMGNGSWEPPSNNSVKSTRTPYIDCHFRNLAHQYCIHRVLYQPEV